VKSLRKKGFGAAVLVIATGTLLAQPAPAPQSPEGTEAAEDPRIARMTPAEMQQELPKLLAQSDKDHKIVLVLQVKARKDKDIVKLTCINDKLIQIKALLNIIDSAKSAFAGATEPAEQTSRYADVSTNVVGVRILREQAQVCAGEIEFRSDTRSDWSGPDIPDDPSKDLFEGGIEPPGYASPFN
jgi:hypothetical protein